MPKPASEGVGDASRVTLRCSRLVDPPVRAARLTPDEAEPSARPPEPRRQHRRARFHQLDAVAERVVDVDPIEAVQWFVVHDAAACFPEPADEARETLDDERRVGLGRGTKVGVDSEMHLEIVALEPASAARREMRGLGNVTDLQHTLVERDRSASPPAGMAS